MSEQLSTRAHVDVDRLIRGLLGLVAHDNRAALAALRRGLGKRPGDVPAMYPVLMQLLPNAPLHDWDETCAFLVASLYAGHRENWSGDGDGRYDRNLGVSLRRLKDISKSDGPERRFVVLLGSEDEAVSVHLRGIVSLLASKQISVDWERLTRDLLHWRHPDRYVQRLWAASFWGERTGDAEAGASGGGSP